MTSIFIETTDHEHRFSPMGGQEVADLLTFFRRPKRAPHEDSSQPGWLTRLIHPSQASSREINVTEHGGEPTAHPHEEKIVDPVVERGIQAATNRRDEIGRQLRTGFLSRRE